MRILLIFGGRSCEHAVSVRSAQSLIAGVRGAPISFQLIGISEQGHWRWQGDDDIESLLKDNVVDSIAGEPVLPDLNYQGKFLSVTRGEHIDFDYDVIFPLMHGPYAEDGKIQGIFEMLGAPYIGCGVLASACGMDKLFSKKLFAIAGIPQADYLEIRRSQWDADASELLNQVEKTLHYPVFIKPANMGSSVGVSKACDRQSLEHGVKEALQFDSKVMVENGFENVIELECAVLGNEEVYASVVGEIRAGAEFYDYDAKYIDDTSEVIIPAPISDAVSAGVQALAIQAFKAIDGSGLARVDFFVDTKTDQIWINEINTLPGFTPISMYPKLWAASGLPYDQLIAKLAVLAVERHKIQKSIKCSFSA